MANRIISLRGEGPWKGKSTRAVTDRGDRRMIKLINGYVSGDGHEIRSMPGFKTLLDPSLENNEANGYFRNIYDFVLPVLHSPIDTSYRYLRANNADYRDQLSLKSRAKPKHLHCFAQINDRLLIIGESDHRRSEIHYTSPNAGPTPGTPGDRDSYVNEPVLITKSGNFYQIQFNKTIEGWYYRDWDPAGTPRAGMHTIAIGDVVFIEDATVADTTAQAEIDESLNGRFHRVTGVTGANATLSTQPVAPGDISSHTPSDIEVWMCRVSRQGTHLTPGVTPYELSKFYAIDDPDALTCWWAMAPLDKDSVAGTLHPSWVANRQRDYGDEYLSPAQWEGVSIDGLATTRRGISRRRQKRLPYRLNPEKAGDRYILAAPGYACLFQVPMLVPVVGEGGWTVSPGAGTWTPGGGQGVLYPLNDVFDKPRCLGLPKAQMIDAMNTTPPNTPNDNNPNDFNQTFVNITPSPVESLFEQGPTYRIAISYEDEATGEEGLASEPITVTFGENYFFGGWFEPAFQIHYMHPGYIMPECLALKLNIYIGEGTTGPMGYYTSLRLEKTSATETGHRSAKYGFDAGTPTVSPDATEFWRTLRIPPPINSSISDNIDTTRLAPTANNMPRGAECARIVRGILLSVGHAGTHGGHMQRTRISHVFNRGTNWTQGSPDVMYNRALRSPSEFTSTPGASAAEDGPWGLASNFFPSAYQGTELWSMDQAFPLPHHKMTVDRIINMMSRNTASTAVPREPSLFQRLRMVEEPADVDVGSPGSPVDISLANREVYWLLPKGQIMVGEPGRPDVALTNTIQFLDPSRDDDGVAVGHYSGAAVICSKHETHTLNWRVAPTGEVPRLVSREFGCIATNSMVEFDGGLAWISERGPVWFGPNGLQHVGEELEEDFYGSTRRYLVDSKGMMRHCWGAHDKSRGLILWGLVSDDATHTISWEGGDRTFAQCDDRGKSRFPCDEILVWSYKANAFSTWRMPSGMEVLWADDLVDTDGVRRLGFLAADTRIYGWDDAYQDSNTRTLTHVATTDGSGTTLNPSSFTFGVDGDNVGAVLSGQLARGSNDTLLRVGMTVVLTDPNGVYKAQTTVSAADFLTQIVTFADSLTWSKDDIFSFGHRPEMEIQSPYVGEAVYNLDVEALQLRFWLPYEGQNLRYSWVHADLLKTDITNIDSSPREVGYTDDGDASYTALGAPKQGHRIGRRVSLTQGRSVGPETSVRLKILGQGQVRISDILLEVT